MSRRARRLAIGGLVVLIVGVVADQAAVRYMSVAPNAEETPPTEPRENESFFKTPTPPPEQLSYELISAKEPRYTVFVLHGMRDSRASMVPWARALVEDGARTVLVDARGHGRSTGKVFSYGVRESQDLVVLADELVARGVVVGPLGVLGFSCGGATAIQWAGRDPRVAAVMAVAPFATMDFVAARVRVPVPSFIVNAVTGQVARKVQIEPAEAGGLPWVEKTHAPILFFHGEEDHSVPVSDSKRMLAHAPPGSEIVVVPNATHPSTLRDDEGVGRARARAWFTARFAK